MQFIPNRPRQFPAHYFSGASTVCEYLGNYFGHDVYHHPQQGFGGLGSIATVFGNEGPDYSSTPLAILYRQLAGDELIGLTDGQTMRFNEWVFSEREASDCHRAMVLALALLGIDRSQK